jgi:hypothetical protein
MFREDCGGMGLELPPEEGTLVWTNGGSTTGMPFGSKGASLLLLRDIPFDRRQADAEEPGHLRFGVPGLDGSDDLAAEVRGICFHLQVCQSAQSLRKVL